MNVHLRSLSGIEGGNSSRIRAKRHAQAVWVSEWITTFQEMNPEWGLIVLGDFNAYQFTDGYIDVLGQITGQPDPGSALVPVEPIVDPPLMNQVFTLPDSERYSYVYQGSAQTLDHILTSEALDAFVSDFSFARGNADAPESFESDETSLLRASDHDGCVLYLNTGSNGVHSPANHLDFRLNDNFPNPFNAETRITFDLPTPMPVTLSVWNLRGRKVVTLTDGILSYGLHTCQWDGKDRLKQAVASGLYLIVLESGSIHQTRKMMLLR